MKKWLLFFFVVTFNFQLSTFNRLYAVVITEKTAGISYESSLGAGWHFNENSGTSTKDIVGVCTGTLYNGVAWAQGKFGSALQFDGYNDYVSTPNYGATDAMSFSFWFKANRVGNGGTGVYSCNMIRHADGTNGWWMEWRNSGSLELFIYVAGTLISFQISASFTDITNWHHLAGVITRNGAVKSWLDNEQKVNSTIGNWTDASVNLLMGSGITGINDPNDYNQFFGGTIDEVCIYNRVLSSDEISSHYQALSSELYDNALARRCKIEWSPLTGVILQTRSAANTSTLLFSSWSSPSSGSSYSFDRYIQYKITFSGASSTFSSLQVSPQFIKGMNLTPASPVKTGSLAFDIYFNENMASDKPTVSFTVADQTYTSTQGLAGGGWQAGNWSDSQHYSVTYTNIASTLSGFATIKLSGAKSATGETISDYTDANILLIDTSNFAATKIGFFPDPFSPNGDGKNETTHLINLQTLNALTRVSVRIYNFKGMLVKTLLDAECGPGLISVPSWDGTDDTGKICPVGIYLFQVKTGIDVKSGTITLTK